MPGRLGHQQEEHHPSSYTIHGHILEVTNSAESLGVHIDSKLPFNTHVSTVSKKAKCTMAFFSRNLSHTSQIVKEAIYTTFIRTTAEFAEILETDGGNIMCGELVDS